MSELNSQQCEPCRVGAPPASAEEIENFLARHAGWELVDVDGEPRVQKQYSFPDFVSALDFANRVGAIAEEQGHHPLLTVEWGKVLVAWWTHKIRNVHRNDLIMAARTDELNES
jgi:4a-hydroxytetrahydrobiopterin dehydratase